MQRRDEAMMLLLNLFTTAPYTYTYTYMGYGRKYNISLKNPKEIHISMVLISRISLNISCLECSLEASGALSENFLEFIIVIKIFLWLFTSHHSKVTSGSY